MKKLLRSAPLLISANIGKFNYKNVAYLEFEVEPSFFDSMLHELIDMHKVSYIASVTGAFNIKPKSQKSIPEPSLKFIKLNIQFGSNHSRYETVVSWLTHLRSDRHNRENI